MVRSKAPAKKKQQIDFKKIKRKLGRKLPPPNNATNTEIKSKAIIIPEQSVAAEKNGFATTDAEVMAIQYGNRDKLCVPLVEAKKNGGDLVEAYAKYVREFCAGVFGLSSKTYSRKHLLDTVVTPESADRLWWFQVCSEVAYFQVAPANDSIRSHQINTEYHLDLYKSLFGKGVYLEVDATNLYYGGDRITATKIIFANGSQDPWRHASKQTVPHLLTVLPSYIVTCHNCGHGSDEKFVVKGLFGQYNYLTQLQLAIHYSISLVILSHVYFSFIFIILTVVVVK